MRSAHSVSLQIYVFPFTCFAFSSFFCHFVSPSPSPLPSFPLIAQTHRAVCPGGGKGEIGAPFRSPASLLPLSRRGPLAGFACFLLTRMSTSERRVGEGRFFFILPPLSSFPLILFCLAACAALACNCTRGVLALCKPPFGQCHCAIEMRGVFPLENPVIPLRPLPLYVGTASWGGEVLFRFAPLVFFSPYSILLGGVRNHCVQLHRRGIGALCAEFRRCIGLSTPPRKEPAWVASGGLREGEKTRVQMHGNGELFAPPSSFVFESGARRVSSNRVVAVRERAQTVPAANETNAGQKRNL